MDYQQYWLAFVLGSTLSFTLILIHFGEILKKNKIFNSSKPTESQQHNILSKTQAKEKINNNLIKLYNIHNIALYSIKERSDDDNHFVGEHEKPTEGTNIEEIQNDEYLDESDWNV